MPPYLVLATVKKNHYYSSIPLHRVEFEALRSFGLHAINETLFVVSLDVSVKASSFG